jgi:hypothetical protein
MRNILRAFGILAIVLLGFTPAHAGFSLTVGTNNSYLSVGDYDYLPYTVASSSYYGTPRVDFYDVMGQYGNWVYAPQFGRVWRPYVSYGWRPYTQGHWIYTQYGPTWVGYEPWAWAAYHYGNWIWTQSYGWVWVPGYDWHAGRVMWSHSSGSIGWSPSPPYGYDYSRGYLSYRGSYNQYTYDDNDFDRDDYYGGQYNRGYNDLYHNSGYHQIAPQIWVFIQINNFNSDNYSNCYFGGSYARQIFENRMVRLTPRPLPRVYVEKNTHQQIREIGVRVKEMQANDHRIKMVIPDGEEDVVRKHANETVKQFIAPGFAEKQKQFKGTASKNQSALARVFKQDNSKPQVEKMSSDQLLNQVKQLKQEGDRRREENEKKQIETIAKIKKQAEVQPTQQKKVDNNDKRNNDFNHGGSSYQEPVLKKTDHDSQFDRRIENRDASSEIERNNQESDKKQQQDRFQQEQIDRQRTEQKRIEQQQLEQAQLKQQERLRQDRLQQDREQQEQLDQQKMKESQRRYEEQRVQEQRSNNRDDQFHSETRNDQPPANTNTDQRNTRKSDETVVDRDTTDNQDASRVQDDKQNDSKQDKNSNKNNDKKKAKKHHQNDNDPDNS